MNTNKSNQLYKPNERELARSLRELCDKYEKKIAKLSEQSSCISGMRLRVCRRRESFQCYLVNSSTGKIKYAPATDSTVKKLAQEDYNARQLKILQKRLKHLKSICLELDEHRLISAYDNLSPERRQLVITDDCSATDFIEKWKNTEYEHKPFISDDVVFSTASGLRVRSKSEIMIAEELDRLGIPYRYEFPVNAGGVVFHPDFMILNTETRREIIWEHFGLLDDSAYRDEFLKKIRLYESAGYRLGANFVFTAETSRLPLTRADIVSVINGIFS